MSQMHPHWQTTDDEVEVPVRVTEKRVSFAPKAADVPQAKRSPAALAGIAMILISGFFSFGGMDLFPAQVAQEAIEVTISESGIEPVEITVRAGQRITWKNTSSIPHILSSETLLDDKDEKFETTAIFPGSEVSFDIPASTPAGTYTYASKTSATIEGTIIVESQITTMAPVTSVASSVSSVSSIPVALPTTVTSVASSISSIAAVSSSSSIQSSDGAEMIDPNGIPVNPFTVANTFNGTVTKGTTTAVTTHRPMTNTESGAGLWILVTSGVVALIAVMRKARVS